VVKWGCIFELDVDDLIDIRFNHRASTWSRQHKEGTEVRQLADLHGGISNPNTGHFGKLSAA